MEPGRAARNDLQRLSGRSRRDQDRKRIALASNASTSPSPLRPVAADAGRLGERAPHAGGGDELVLRLIPAKHLAHFKQTHVGEAAIGVLLGGGDKAGNEARPHVGKFGRNRIGQRKLGLAAAEAVRPAAWR